MHIVTENRLPSSAVPGPLKTQYDWHILEEGVHSRGQVFKTT